MGPHRRPAAAAALDGDPAAGGPARGSQRSACSSAAGLAATALPLVAAVLLLPLLSTPVSAVFYPVQNITDQSAKYCGFSELKRYTIWCVNANISAFVASNTTCQVYGVCIPLDGAEEMTCTNKTYCNRIRDTSASGYKAVAACLVVKAAVNGSVAMCDIFIQGPSIFDSPPPTIPPPPPLVPKPPKKHSNWKLWKTLTLIFSITGGIAVIVIVVLLIRYFLNRRKKNTSTPVTVLTEEEKQKIEAESQGRPPGQTTAGQPGVLPPQTLTPGQLIPPGGTTDLSGVVRPTAPDGTPILASGATYPAQAPLGAGAASGRLAPNTGDAILNAAVSSRSAYNNPPMRAPATMPGLSGVPASMPPLPPPLAPPGGAVGGAGEPPPAVMPAALVPLTAATLQNPTGTP